MLRLIYRQIGKAERHGRFRILHPPGILIRRRKMRMCKQLDVLCGSARKLRRQIIKLEIESFNFVHYLLFRCITVLSIRKQRGGIHIRKHIVPVFRNNRIPCDPRDRFSAENFDESIIYYIELISDALCDIRRFRGAKRPQNDIPGLGKKAGSHIGEMTVLYLHECRSILLYGAAQQSQIFLHAGSRFAIICIHELRHDWFKRQSGILLKFVGDIVLKPDEALRTEIAGFGADFTFIEQIFQAKPMKQPRICGNGIDQHLRLIPRSHVPVVPERDLIRLFHPVSKQFQTLFVLGVGQRLHPVGFAVKIAEPDNHIFPGGSSGRDFRSRRKQMFLS